MIVASLYPCPFDVQDRHEFNAAILKDGTVFAYEEGKCTSIKNDGTTKFPERSLMMGFKELDILPHEVDKWVFPTPKTVISEDSFFLFFSWAFKAFVDDREHFASWFSSKVEFVDHQVGHAALAVLASGFDQCCFLCMDGGGDFGDPRGYLFGEFDGGEFKYLFESQGTDNIANFHSFLTDSIGFNGEDNGKTSGLASYGEVDDQLKDGFEKLLTVSVEEGVKFSRQRFAKTHPNLAKVRADTYDRSKIFSQFPSDTNVFRLSLGCFPQDVAATGEKVLQESVLRLISLLKKHTSMDKIVFSGGLFQNVALNGRLIQSEFSDYYFPSAPSDSGLALGAALFVENKFAPVRRTRSLTAFNGPSFPNAEIEEVLISHRLVYQTMSDQQLNESVAQLISTGNTVGWFVGAAEHGPRSLGARSLLADPRSSGSKERINQLLKKRDWFMPYAPSILEEYLADWVDQVFPSPYMQVALRIKSEMVDQIPSAVHVDGSCRVHVVEKDTCPKYWNLIEAFRNLTGVPVLLNTSFNRHGISTISTPRQAVEHLLEGCMDYLAIGNFLVEFDKNRIAVKPSQTVTDERLLLTKLIVSKLQFFDRHGSVDDLAAYLAKIENMTGRPLRCNASKQVLVNHQVAQSVSEAVQQLNKMLELNDS